MRLKTTLVRYGSAALSVAGMTGFRFALRPILGLHHPFITYYFAVVVTSWFCGLGPSLFALALSIVLAFTLFGRLSQAFHPDTDMLTITLLSTGVCLAIIAYGEVNRRYRRRLEEEVAVRKRAEEEARAHEEQFEFLTDMLPHVIYTAAPDGSFCYVNHAALKEGFPWETVSQNLERCHPDDRERVTSAMAHSMATGEPFNQEFRCRTREGYHWYWTQAVPARDKEGRITKWFGVRADINDLKTYQRELEAQVSLGKIREAELEAARKAAEAANETRDVFLGKVSHELRTPLQPAMLAVNELCKRDDLPEDALYWLRMVNGRIKDEARLIDDLIDISRFNNTNRVNLRWDIVNLHALIHSALIYCGDAIRESNLSVQTEFQAKNFLVNGDEFRLQQVLVNLIRNAAKFAQKGSLVVRTLDGEGDRLIIEFEDTGIGFAEGQLPRIFGHFEQGENSLIRQFGGLGLGLTLGRFIVAAHHGEISAQSKGVNRGSTFRLSLPSVEPGFTPHHQRAMVKIATDVSLGGVRALLTEDDPQTRELLSRSLQGEGLVITTCAGVTESLGAAGPFDLLLCDIGLPDGTGYDVLRHVKGNFPEAGTIAITGGDYEGAEDGFDYHITKPLQAEQLIAAMKFVLRRSRYTVDVPQGRG